MGFDSIKKIIALLGIALGTSIVMTQNLKKMNRAEIKKIYKKLDLCFIFFQIVFVSQKVTQADFSLSEYQNF